MDRMLKRAGGGDDGKSGWPACLLACALQVQRFQIGVSRPSPSGENPAMIILGDGVGIDGRLQACIGCLELIVTIDMVRRK